MIDLVILFVSESKNRSKDIKQATKTLSDYCDKNGVAYMKDSGIFTIPNYNKLELTFINDLAFILGNLILTYDACISSYKRKREEEEAKKDDDKQEN